MKFKIKQYQDLTRDELYEVLALRTNIFVVEQNCPYPELDFKDHEAFHIWQELKGELIGTARIFIGPESNSIGRICVHQHFRKQEFGKLLVKKAIDFCKSQNQHQIIISAQQYLERFYHELGFEPTKEKYLEDDIPHMKMIHP